LERACGDPTGGAQFACFQNVVLAECCFALFCIGHNFRRSGAAKRQTLQARLRRNRDFMKQLSFLILRP
jgi:hypothetical protein